MTEQILSQATGELSDGPQPEPVGKLRHRYAIAEKYQPSLRRFHAEKSFSESHPSRSASHGD